MTSSVLIIDDEMQIRKSLCELFQSRGALHVREATSAEEGLRILEEEPFSLIVCDHHLPGMTGLAFMGKLRLKQDMTPILIITGLESRDTIRLATNQLKTAFLAKPFSSNQLFEAVDALLQ